MPHRPVNTFSIVARDAATGQIGVAVQSHWFSVGQIVPWAEAGVGAVATQSFVDPSYGPLGLDLMRAGKSPHESLISLIWGDGGRAVRQVAMINAKGDVSVWTGTQDIQAAGHAVGANGNCFTALQPRGQVQTTCGSENNPGGSGVEDFSQSFKFGGGYLFSGKDFSAEANLMSNPNIWPAMAKTFKEAKGDLAERMLAALDAAQAAGGDIRGRQSAALIVVEGKRQNAPWEGRIFDLRVDDAAEPLKDLRRLVVLQRAYNHMNAGDLAVEHKDNEAALREYAEAEKIASNTPGILPSRLAEMIYWHAVALVNMNRVDDALPLFKKCFTIEKSWAELTLRLPAAGLLPNDSKLIERIVAQANP